jgi:DNA polymerase-3 subunit epsilon
MDPIEAGIDIETTGLEKGDHRIIEIYIGLYREDKLLREYNQRIDPQRSIAKEAQDVHKISSADLVGMPTWSYAAPTVHAFLTKADVHVAHNSEFDLPFIAYELKRMNLIMPERTVIDTMQFSWATPDGKKPSLRELCLATDLEYDETQAHAAFYDVDRMMQALFQARRFGIELSPVIAAQNQQAA